MTKYNPFSLEGKNILIEGLSSEIAQSLKNICLKSAAHVLEVPIDMTIEHLNDFVATCPTLDGLSLTQDATKSIMSQFVTEKDLADFLTKNVTNKILLCKLLYKSKKLKKGASVVFSTSIAGIDNVHYGDIINATCSSAILGMTKSLGLEFATKGIRVNHVRFGVIATKDISEGRLLTKEELSEKEAFFPLKRFGRPEEVANAVLYLLSSASTWVTGSEIRVDGGYSVL